MKDNLKIITSNDGSHTLYRKDIDEHYHSIHGSIQESMHVFINAGLREYLKTKQVGTLNILEIGFGTGLNTLLTIQENQKLKQNILYHTIEPFPIPHSIIEKINFKEINSEVFVKLHEVNWEINNSINDNFTFLKRIIKIEDYNPTIKYDLIYYDAFGPNSQQEMWELKIFKQLYNMLNKNGFLVTYCAKGQVRRDLESVGFKMERLPGPIGKREMLRGKKS